MGCGMSKLKIEIDLSDLYAEVECGESNHGEFNMQDLFRDAIKAEVKAECRNMIREEVKVQARHFVVNELAPEMRAEIKTHIKEFLATKELSLTSYNGKTVDQCLEAHFSDLIGRGPLIDEVRELAKRWGVELKRQYDIAYANKLVQTLNDQGLLLPNVGQLLLDKQG